MTPEQAAAHARQWEALAAARTGEERARAITEAQGWWREHARLSAAAGRVPAGYAAPAPQRVPSQQPLGVTPYAGPPSGPVPYGAPAYGGATPYPAGPPQRRRTSGCLVALIVTLVVGVATMLVIGLVVTSLNRVVEAGPTTAPTVYPSPTQVAPSPTAPTDPPTTAEPTPEPTTAPPMTDEEMFLGGYWELPLPDPVPLSSPLPRFSDTYADATEWFAGHGIPEITAVATDDPTLNCGFGYANSDTFVHAGCYQTNHRDIVFVWWNEDSTFAQREFLVAHEYSHWYQWHEHFDVMNAARLQGFFTDSQAWRDAMESDATCRVLSWGGYDATVAAESSTPCTTDGWYEGWLIDAAVALGVQL
ncbi:hypothetical protein EDD28_1084 [Salana multivorans]|uniref:Uncharacterized protein n=1 Tax=Salana multivorans TaxID=120377 RepID=A0A3N2D9P9_9MICO|nr:hypothetical protein [Salana multivorans]ROR96499.1 hypothetical protein EDD28_1084 [Salana multivorans]